MPHLLSLFQISPSKKILLTNIFPWTFGFGDDNGGWVNKSPLQFLTSKLLDLNANWIRVGQTKGTAKRSHDHLFHGKIEDVYLYPLRKDFRKKLTG